jgi:flagellar hook-length control protein FliK
MSSLRVSHHNRGLGALPGAGDAARSDSLTADDTASFAATLGMAGLSSADGSAAAFGGTGSDSSGGEGPSRKRRDGQVPLGDAAASVAAQSSSLALSNDTSLLSDWHQDRAADGTVQSATVPPFGVGRDLPGVSNSERPGASGSRGARVPGLSTATDVGAPAAGAPTSAEGIASASWPPAPLGLSASITVGGSGAAATAIRSSIDGSSTDTGQAVVVHSPDATTKIVANGLAIAHGQPATASLRPAAPRRAASATAEPTAGTAATPSDDGVATPVPTTAQSPSSASVPDASAAGWVPVDPAVLSATDTNGADFTPAVVTGGMQRLGRPQITSASITQLTEALRPPGSALPIPDDSGVAAVGDGDRGRLAVPAAASDTSNTVSITSFTDAGATAPSPSGASALNVAAPATVAASIPGQVAGHVIRMISNGSRDMVLRLRPPELGDLTVRVEVSGRDVSAWFASPQPEVQSAITAAIGQLQTSLGDAGYNLNGAWVGADSSSAQQQGTNQSPSPALRAPDSVPAVGPPTAVASPAARSGLNIYV